MIVPIAMCLISALINQKAALVGGREIVRRLLQWETVRALLDSVAIATTQQSYLVVNSWEKRQDKN